MNGKKVTIYDIADAANVSVGTVHRALSNKGRISPTTKQLILDVAENLGYKINVAAQGLRRSPIKIGAILFCPVEEYVDSIIDGIMASGDELEKYNVVVDIRKVDYVTSEECLKTSCELIQSFSDENYNGIILFMSANTEEMVELSSLVNDISKTKNIPFATVANDIESIDKVIHVGTNAFMAGNMAAEMLQFSCAGEDVALLVASKTTPINAEYINGFLNYAGNNIFSNISIYEHYDNKEKVIETTKRMLKDNPNLKGVYMATASSVLACNCIKETNKTNLSIITTDLLSETPNLLKSSVANATILQKPYKQGKTVVRLLYNFITSKTDFGVHLIPPNIILSSNVDSYLFENSN